MRTILSLVIALCAIQAGAAEIYKCKGPNGEIEFTNIKCSDNSTRQSYRTYTPEADNPSLNNPDAREPQSTGLRTNASNPGGATKSQHDINTDLADIETEDPRSSLGSAARAARLELEYGTGSITARQAAYAQTMAELRAQATGTPTPQVVTQQVRAARSPTKAVHPPTDTKRITSCRSDAGNGITCFDTSGQATHGRIDAAGNAVVGGERLRRDGTGKLETGDGVCVKDIYGQCQ